MSDRYRNRSRSREKERHRDRSRSPQRQSHGHSRQNRQSKTTKQSRRQQPQEQTKTLCVQQIPSQLLSQLQSKLIDTSISVGTSVPDEVYIADNVAIMKYPSTQVALSIYNYLKGFIILSSKQYKLKYYPLKKSDINVLYDWYCDKCDYKNFARRGKCHRCDNEKNPNCKLNYGSQFVSFAGKAEKKQEIQDQVNCSLMIRGQAITEVEEEVLLNLFEAMAPIKDIRMIRNKVTGGNKDFAFVEFFSPEEAAMALRKANAPDFRVMGQKVTVMYSRTKQDDQYFARPYDKDRRGPPPPRRQSKYSQDQPNYYIRQRQLQIQQQKKRPLITLQQLKQKREQELKKSLPQQSQMTQQQNQRKKAEMLAKQWEREMKQQTLSIIYLCPLCKRKFKNQDEMIQHGKKSELHQWKLRKFQQEKLVL